MALGIGLRAIEERFGRTLLEKYMPYEAVLLRKEWIVAGNIDLDGRIAKLREAVGPGNFVSNQGSGAAPDASISAEDGRFCQQAVGDRRTLASVPGGLE